MTPTESPDTRGRLLPVVLLHLAAALACFAFLVIVPIAICVVVMIVDNDPGGPMFFAMFVILTVVFAALATVLIGAAALLSKWLRRRRRVPLWLPPVGVFVLASSAFWFLATDGVQPVGAAIVGALVTSAFTIYWAAISATWFLPRLLSRLFRAA